MQFQRRLDGYTLCMTTSRRRYASPTNERRRQIKYDVKYAKTMACHLGPAELTLGEMCENIKFNRIEDKMALALHEMR